MANQRQGISRRTILGCGAVAAFAIAGVETTARAQGGTVPREQVLYVDETQKPDQFCANCVHWQGTPVAEYSALDQSSPEQADCAIVAGKVSALGWCGVYAPRG